MLLLSLFQVLFLMNKHCHLESSGAPRRMTSQKRGMTEIQVGIDALWTTEK